MSEGANGCTVAVTQRVLGGYRVSTAEGLTEARRHLEACRAALEFGVYYSLRSCLEARHGVLVRAHNDALTNALKALW